MNEEQDTTEGTQTEAVQQVGPPTDLVAPGGEQRKNKYATRKSALENRLDKRVIRRMAFRGCTIVEIAATCGCAVSTLKTPKWHKIIERQRSKLKSRLRLAQISSAIKDKNVPMLIHLGKHVLGQKDQAEQKERPSLNIVFVDGKGNGQETKILERESHLARLELPEALPEHE